LRSTRDLTKNGKRTNDGVRKTLETQNTCGAISVFFTQYLQKIGVVFGLDLVGHEVEAYLRMLHSYGPEKQWLLFLLDVSRVNIQLSFVVLLCIELHSEWRHDLVQLSENGGEV
jgi:hypothetical protein